MITQGRGSRNADLHGDAGLADQLVTARLNLNVVGISVERRVQLAEKVAWIEDVVRSLPEAERMKFARQVRTFEKRNHVARRVQGYTPWAGAA